MEPSVSTTRGKHARKQSEASVRLVGLATKTTHGAVECRHVESPTDLSLHSASVSTISRPTLRRRALFARSARCMSSRRNSVTTARCSEQSPSESPSNSKVPSSSQRRNAHLRNVREHPYDSTDLWDLASLRPAGDLHELHRARMADVRMGLHLIARPWHEHVQVEHHFFAARARAPIRESWQSSIVVPWVVRAGPQDEVSAHWTRHGFELRLVDEREVLGLQRRHHGRPVRVDLLVGSTACALTHNASIISGRISLR